MHGADWAEFAGSTATHSHSGAQAARFIIGSLLALGVGAITIPLWLGPGTMNGSLIISARGVQCRRPISAFIVDWDDIVEIDDDFRQGRQNRLKPIVFRLADGREKVCSLYQFGDQATDLYSMIADYQRHPERRVELSNGRAAQRLGDRDVDPTRDR
jgi:hypothetical protein